MKKNTREEILRYPIEFTSEQKKKFQKEDKRDIVDFIKKTQAWVNSPSSNDEVELR